MILGIFLGYLANMSIVLDEKTLRFFFFWWLSRACGFGVREALHFFPSTSFQAQKHFHSVYRWRFHAVWLLQWWKRRNRNLQSDLVFVFTVNNFVVFKRLKLLVNHYILYINKKKKKKKKEPIILTLCSLSWERPALQGAYAKHLRSCS